MMWTLSDPFHATFLAVNVCGVTVSSWALSTIVMDLRARARAGENGPIEYATLSNLKQESHRFIVQAGFVVIALLRAGARDAFLDLPPEALQATASIIAVTGLQSAVMLWGSLHGRWTRYQLARMIQASARAGGRRATDPHEGESR